MDIFGELGKRGDVGGLLLVTEYFEVDSDLESFIKIKNNQ